MNTMKEIGFGWRIPSFPVDKSRGSTFVNQVTMNLKEVEGLFDSAWISDHFVPWASFFKSRCGHIGVLDNVMLSCWCF